MGRLFLIHWNAAEAGELAEPLRADGWEVTIESQDGARGGKKILASPPDVAQCWLTRLPSHGRENMHAVRSYQAGRNIPIVFVGGEGEALAKTKATVPDAKYVTPGRLKTALKKFARS